MKLEEIIKTVKHDLDYFQEPRSEMQRGRAFEANKILSMLTEHQAQLQQHVVIESLPPETTGYIIYNNDKVNSILGAALRNLDTHQLCTLRDCLIRRTPPTEGGNAP